MGTLSLVSHRDDRSTAGKRTRRYSGLPADSSTAVWSSTARAFQQDKLGPWDRSRSVCISRPMTSSVPQSD